MDRGSCHNPVAIQHLSGSLTQNLVMGGQMLFYNYCTLLIVGIYFDGHGGVLRDGRGGGAGSLPEQGDLLEAPGNACQACPGSG